MNNSTISKIEISKKILELLNNRMELKFVAEKILKISDFRTKQRLFKEFLIKIKSFSKNEF